jgi:hypothetical protein
MPTKKKSAPHIAANLQDIMKRGLAADVGAGQHDREMVHGARGPPLPEPEAVVYLTAPQVCQRYGNRSHMWLERKLASDPSFPRPRKFGRAPGSWRFFKITELVEWERAAAAKSNAA